MDDPFRCPISRTPSLCYVCIDYLPELCQYFRADLVRALDRQGLDPQAKEKIERELSTAFRDLKKQRDAEEKQRKIEEEMERRRLAEEAAEEESRLRKAADDEDWAAFSDHLRTTLHLTKDGETPPGSNIISAIELTLHKNVGNGQKEEIPVRAQWHSGEDVSHAAFRFCSANMLHATNEVANVANHLRQRVADASAAPPPPAGKLLHASCSSRRGGMLRHSTTGCSIYGRHEMRCRMRALQAARRLFECAVAQACLKV